VFYDPDIIILFTAPPTEPLAPDQVNAAAIAAPVAVGAVVIAGVAVAAVWFIKRKQNMRSASKNLADRQAVMLGEEKQRAGGNAVTPSAAMQDPVQGSTESTGWARPDTKKINLRNSTYSPKPELGN
jgi:hypothetical protein